MSEQLRGSIAGFGRMGMTHFSILNTHPKVDFVSVCEPSSFVRKNIEQQLRIKTHENYLSMLAESKPDFVIISTPTGLHAEQALQAIQQGVHVFMEKPFTLSDEDGTTVLEALSTRRIVNQVGYVIRFNDIFQSVKKILDAGELGRLVNFEANVRGPTILRDVKKGWRATKNQGGGCLRDFASHAIDMTHYLFGPPLYVRGSVLQHIYSTKVDDAVHCSLIYEHGAVGTVSGNWSDPSYRKPTYKFDIHCTRGRIIADLHQFKIYFRDEPTNDKYERGWNSVYVTDIANPVRFYVRGHEFTRQLDYFVDQIFANCEDNVCSFRDAYSTDRTIEKISEHAEIVRKHG